MLAKRKIIVFIDWFYPAFKAGGPVKSIYNIVESLKTKVDFLIVTSNQEIDNSLLNVEPNAILNKDGYQVIYLESKNQNIRYYKTIIRTFEPTHVYLNSTFSPSFTIKPLLACKSLQNLQIIIAPRGTLGRGALALKSLKKKIFLSVLKKVGLVNRVVWHASTELEASEVKAIFGLTANIKVATNISSMVNQSSKPINKLEGESSYIFIARICKTKNLNFIIKLLTKLDKEIPFSFDIYGPIEDKEYWESCKELIGGDTRIRYKGILEPMNIASTLRKYHFFVLPSFSENYGHVIVEAINTGVPVIISDRTPWLNLRENKVGWVTSLDDNDAWDKVIAESIEMNKDEYFIWSNSCKQYSAQNIVNEEVILQNETLFIGE